MSDETRWREIILTKETSAVLEWGLALGDYMDTATRLKNAFIEGAKQAVEYKGGEFSFDTAKEANIFTTAKQVMFLLRSVVQFPEKAEGKYVQKTIKEEAFKDICRLLQAVLEKKEAIPLSEEDKLRMVALSRVLADFEVSVVHVSEGFRPTQLGPEVPQ